MMERQKPPKNEYSRRPASRNWESNNEEIEAIAVEEQNVLHFMQFNNSCNSDHACLASD